MLTNKDFQGPISDAHIPPCYEGTRVPPFSPQYQGQGGKGREKNILPCTSHAVFGLLYASQVHR